MRFYYGVVSAQPDGPDGKLMHNFGHGLSASAGEFLGDLVRVTVNLCGGPVVYATAEEVPAAELIECAERLKAQGGAR